MARTHHIILKIRFQSVAAMKLYIDFGLRAFDTQALHVRVSVMTCFLLSAHFCSYHSWFFAAIVVYSKQRNTNFHFG